MDSNQKRIQLEKKIVRRVIRSLRVAGYLATQVWNGDEYVKVFTEQETLDAVFAVDDATVHFDGGKGDNNWAHGVYFVLGNGRDVISDYHCGDEKFAKVVDGLSDWASELKE